MGRVLDFIVKLKKAGVDSALLENLVLSCKKKEAADINSLGMGFQLQYLFKSGVSEQEILDALGIVSLLNETTPRTFSVEKGNKI